MPVPKRTFYFRYAAYREETEKHAMEQRKGISEATSVKKKRISSPFDV